MKLKILLTLMLFCPAGGFAQQLTDTLSLDPHVTISKLPNGLTYYIRANKKPENRAELRLAVNVGSVLEDEKQRGLAHVVEHMAFNGTTHFAKQDLVKYLESIGMKFGADLNAYTSFDETVYMLTVPTDTGRALEQGVQILEDWAHGQTFDSQEIDKERGVVIEEWRLGQGAEERLRARYFPVLFANSRYAERMPIGTRQNLDTFSHQDLVRFYRQWYRPELMAVIAVGDFDKIKVEEMIKARFGNLVSADTTSRTMFPVPDHDSTMITIATDKEATVASVNIYNKLPVRSQKTVSDYRLMLAQQLFMHMLNERLHELTQQPNPPFIGASGGEGSLIRTKEAFVLSAETKDDGLLRGLESILTETARVQRFGFTSTELEREKQNVLRGYEQANAEREKTESSDYAAEYVSSFLEGDPIPGIETEYDLVKKLLPQIPVPMVNEFAKEWLTDRNRVVVVQAPEKPSVKVPSIPQIQDVFALVRAKNIKAYDDRVADTSLIPTLPRPGRILSETRDTATNVTAWKLSNGVRVLLKPTDFQADQVLVRGYSPGGTSLVADKDYVSALLATTLVGLSGLGQLDAIQLNKTLAGKAAQVFPFIDDRREGFSAQASPKDIETMFQLIYLTATAPRRDTASFQSLHTRLAAVLENQSASPEAAFRDTVEVTLAQHHFRARPFTMKLLAEASLDRALAVYQDRFADASDFTFVIVGNFTPDSIRPLVQRYLGGLPAAHRKESPRDVGVRPPKGVIDRIVRKGVEPKSTTEIVFTGPMIYTTENRLALSLMADIFEIRLRNILREDMGGTYGVDIGATTSRYPTPNYAVSISFGANPARLDSLTGAVFQQIALLKSKGVSAEEIAKAKETQRRGWETNVKRNEYWVGVISSRDEAGEPLAAIMTFPQRLNRITAAQIDNAARVFLNEKNFVRVSLRPER